MMDTTVAVMNAEVSELTYRGYPVEELCRHCSFEEVAYLLWHGELPVHDQLSAQNRAERAQRAIGPHVAAVLAAQPSTAHPLDTLRAAVSVIGAHDSAEHDVTPAAIRAKALRLFAVLPSVIALDQRRRQGLGAVAPRGDLGYAANFLYMTFGKVPEPQVVAAFEKSLILQAGYGFNGSTFTGRVTFAYSDLYSAVAAAIGALNGPQHRGSEAVVRMLDDVAIPDNARPWLDEALADDRDVMGFGHRVYKNGDATVPPMRAALGMIAALRGGQHLVEVYDALAAAMCEAKGLRPNLDYPVGPAYHLIGFDTLTFTPILAAARLPCWTARVAEQPSADSYIRPLSTYRPAERHVAIKR
jgi:citrate synthase